MKKILVTGAGGFIGSHLAERLVEDGHRVKAFIRYNSKNNWGWLEESKYKNEMEIVAGDIRDYDSVHAASKDCDRAIHLAALIGIPYSYVSPLAYIRTNVEGTYNILQSAKELGMSQILITSTSETYGTAQYVPIDEKHPMVGQSPYSASKIAADQLAISFYRSFDLPVKIVRPFNTYGPRQSSRAIIPTIINQILSGQKTLQLGNLEPSRDFTFIKDTVSAFIAILNSDKLFGEMVNVGMQEDVSVGDLAKLIAELMEENIEIAADQRRVRPERSEVERLRCDHSKLLANTGWKPKYRLKQGLSETIEWCKSHHNMDKAQMYHV